MEYQPLRVNPITYATHGLDYGPQTARISRVRGEPLTTVSSVIIRMLGDFKHSLEGESGNVTKLFDRVFIKGMSNPNNIVLVNTKRRFLKHLMNATLSDYQRLEDVGIYFTQVDKEAPRLYFAHKTYITL